MTDVIYGECIISEVNFGLYSYGYLGYREWSRCVAGLSTPMHRIWMTVKGIAFSLEEIWKAVSVTMFCSGCMSNNWQWYTHFIVVKLQVQYSGLIFLLPITSSRTQGYLIWRGRGHISCMFLQWIMISSTSSKHCFETTKFRYAYLFTLR